MGEEIEIWIGEVLYQVQKFCRRDSVRRILDLNSWFQMYLMNSNTQVEFCHLPADGLRS